MNRKTLVHTVLAGALMAGVAVPVGAVTLTYDASGGFEPGQEVCDPFCNGVVYGGNPDPAGDSLEQVAWGNPIGTGGAYSGKSYMEINGNAPTTYFGGNVDLNDLNGALLGDLTHYNEPIAATGGDQAQFTVDYHLTLSDGGPLQLYYRDMTPGDSGGTELHWGVGSSGPDQGFILDLWETLNAAPCTGENVNWPAGSDPGLPGISLANPLQANVSGSTTPCDDAHAFEPLGWMTMGFADYGGELYKIQIAGFFDGPSATDNLTGTFWADEGAPSDTAYVRFRVVPEPATIALLGLGLAGMGFAARRKKA